MPRPKVIAHRLTFAGSSQEARGAPVWTDDWLKEQQRNLTHGCARRLGYEQGRFQRVRKDIRLPVETRFPAFRSHDLLDAIEDWRVLADLIPMLTIAPTASAVRRVIMEARESMLFVLNESKKTCNLE